MKDRQQAWKKHLQLMKLLYRSSVLAVKNSPGCLVLGMSMRLPNDCVYKTRHTEVSPTQSDFKLNIKRELQMARFVMKTKKEVKQSHERHTTKTKLMVLHTVKKNKILFSAILAKKRKKRFSSFITRDPKRSWKM